MLFGKIRSLATLMYFHRRRAAVSVAFTAAYGYLCWKGKHVDNELIRMGIAGSITHTFVECLFHSIDTINVRAKAHEHAISSYNTLKTIYVKDGVYGFFRGFSATFYGSVFCGFIYFSTYKAFKSIF